MKRDKFVRGIGLTAMVALMGAQVGCADASSGGAEGFSPNRVDFIIPSGPGGSTDLIGRAFIDALEDPLDTQITPENRQGANGAVGGKAALAQAPDGETLVTLFQSLMAITPLAVEDDDPIGFEDMDVLAALTIEDYVLVVNSDETDIDSLDELLEEDGLSFGSSGVGTGGQLSQALLFGQAGVSSTDVPLDGGAEAVTSLLGGHVDVASVHIAEAAPYLDDGSFTPIVTFAEEREEFLPDVPTATEEGYDVVVDQKRFVAAPAGLDEAASEAYTEAIDEALQDEAYLDYLEDNYISVWEEEPDAVADEIDGAASTYESQLDELGVTLDE
ncbi:tripartite tricarboxylate transporter substrate binding protein [Nocardiopsis oceani]